MVDIDHFKQVNDIHGHPVGDDVIRRVADMMRDCSRTSDIICRFGGEEFCILLPETDEAGAIVWAERLRQQVNDLRIPAGETELQVTISLGVPEMLADMESLDELVGLADECLLAAKVEGRDRVVALRPLSNDSGLAGTATDCGLTGIVARDVMIPLVHWLRPECPIVDAAVYFLNYRVSSAPVVDPDGNLVGIVSDKNVLSITHFPNAMDRQVSNIMRSNVITFDETAPLAKVLRFLTRASMRSVVITSDGLPSGLVSRSVIVRWLLQNPWASVNQTEGLDDESSKDASPEVESALMQISDELCTEAKRLHQYLGNSTTDDRDRSLIFGGASRMQELITDILANAASARPISVGLPF